MYLIKLTLFLLFFVSASEPTTETSLALHPKHGWIVCNVLDGPKIKKRDPTKVPVSYKYYLSPSNLSSDTIEVEPQKIIPQVKQTNLSLQGKDRTISPGLIVLGKDKKPYRVEAIFADGRAAFSPLELNCVSRYRLSDGRCFAPAQKTNRKIMPVSDISAIEQKCFLQSYCVGTTLSKINDIPLCALYKINGKDVANQGLNCGLKNEIKIGAAFSDGTLLFGNTLLNLFPDATLKYQRSTPEATTAQ